MNLNNNKIKKLLERNVEQIITEDEFFKKMLSGRKLRIKHGVDATNPNLHIGHAVDYWKMREFQELGHKIIFLIGDFTTTIGDPTGKSKTRPEINEQQIKKNAQKFLSQITKILINKPSVLEIRRNSEWYNKMKLREFISLLRKITHSQLIERDMFQKRVAKNEDISMHEMIYPVLQGYDSVMLRSDITIIGTDQLFNEIIGRKYQVIFNQSPQTIITTTITPGLDGKEKMSKSLGNFVALLDEPKDKFGKIMSIPDNLVEIYLKTHTNLAFEEIDKVKNTGVFPAKKRLAFEIVKLYDGETAAEKSQSDFEKTFSKKEAPENLKTYIYKKGENWADFLVRNNLVSSKSEAKRLIGGGGIDLNGSKIQNQNNNVDHGVVKIGKYKFIRAQKE